MILFHAARRLLYALGAVACGIFGGWSWLVGPRPRLPLRAAEVRRVLVIRLDLLGDVVFSLPAVAALAETYPAARIEILALPYTAPILERVPAVAAVHTLDVNRFRRPQGWTRVGELVGMVRTLRAQQYDLAVGLSGLMGGVFAVLSGARWRLGYEGETYRGAYNIPVPGRRYRRRAHEIDYCLDLVRTLDATAASRAGPRGARTAGRFRGGAGGDTDPGNDLEDEARITPHLGWPARAGLDVSAVHAPAPPYVVLIPGASNGSAKRWPGPYWAALGDRLHRERGLRVVLSGATGERRLAEMIARAMEEACDNLAGATSLDELAQLLAGATFVVAGDTGPLHLAAALGTPVVGVYGPTDPANSGPRAAQAAVVRLGLSCSPCYDLRTPADCKLPDRSLPCMWGVTPDRVYAAIAGLLDEPQAPGGARAAASDDSP